jgi:hypothetical protein
MKLPRYPYEWKEKGPKLEIRIGPRVASGNSVDSDGPEEGRGPDPTQHRRPGPGWEEEIPLEDWMGLLACISVDMRRSAS